MTIAEKQINMKYILMVFTLIFSTILSAQSDKKAEELLQKVIDKTASYENFKAELSYTMVNKEMDIDEKKTGLIYVKGDNYRIEMEGQVIISNTETVWTYLEDSEEVMVSNVEDSDESVSPTKILTTYNKDYKARFDPDKKYKNANLKVIDLKPNEGKQFEHMSVLVNEKNLSLESFSVYDKNGNVFTYQIINLTPNLELPEDTFVFDTAKYPDVEVIDMR
jgi:outer membrane lipoprotein-sorting protein